MSISPNKLLRFVHLSYVLIGTAFLGLISASLFISSITNLVLRFQKLHQETFMNTRKLLRYLSENHVSPDLTVRIKLFAKRATGAAIMTAEDVDILKTLPSHLLQELNIEIKSLTLHMNIVLKRIVYKVPHAKHQLCLDAITEAHVNSSGLVFGYLEKSNQMFIISKGKVMYHPSPARKESLSAVEQSNNSYLQPERLSMADARSSASDRSSVDSSLNPPRVSSSSDREELSGDARRDNSRVSKDSKQNLLGLPKTFSRTFSIQKIFKASRADTGEIVVEAGRTIAEMNIWTEWQHQGDCMLAGSASIFSVKVDAFTKVLSSEKYHNVGLALDISHYSNHYLQWLNSSSDQGHQINDLSYAPNLVMDHESSLVSAMRRMGQHMRPGHIFRR